MSSFSSRALSIGSMWLGVALSSLACGMEPTLEPADDNDDCASESGCHEEEDGGDAIPCDGHFDCGDGRVCQDGECADLPDLHFVAECSGARWRTRTVALPASLGKATDFVFGDFDGDPAVDLVVNDGTTLWVIPGTSVEPIPEPSFSAPAGDARILTARVNGDPLDDLVLVGPEWTDELRIYLADGAGGFSAAIVSGPIPSWREFAGAVDFDDDGSLDVIVHDQIWWGAGDGTFTVGPTLPMPPRSAYGFGYVDADPTPEILAPVEHVGVLLADPSGETQPVSGWDYDISVERWLTIPSTNAPDDVLGLSAPSNYSLISVVGWKSTSVGVTRRLMLAKAREDMQLGDIDGDGDLDLLLDGSAIIPDIRNPTPPCVESLSPGAGGPFALGDFDGDGQDEVAGVGVGPTLFHVDAE